MAFKDSELIHSIQPIVLVGGKSSRFGRDKLLEPIAGDPIAGDEVLVDRPIAALRRVFGPRVALVGECDESVAARADRVITDPYPGTGPIGGVLAALEHTESDLFVLAGDLPAIDARTILGMLQSAASHPDAWAVIGHTDRPQPCLGVYRRASIDALSQAIKDGRRALGKAIPEQHLRLVPLDIEAARNINTLEDLR